MKLDLVAINAAFSTLASAAAARLDISDTRIVEMDGRFWILAAIRNGVVVTLKTTFDTFDKAEAVQQRINRVGTIDLVHWIKDHRVLGYLAWGNVYQPWTPVGIEPGESPAN